MFDLGGALGGSGGAISGGKLGFVVGNFAGGPLGGAVGLVAGGAIGGAVGEELCEGGPVRGAWMLVSSAGSALWNVGGCACETTCAAADAVWRLFGW
jgi:hypothetical protein